MKILAITAGAANMYCGSCLRDNALAAELMAQGHDVVLVPLYTPTLTDEPNVSRKRVFFGGISVYLEQHVAPFRFTPAWIDRLWDSWPSRRSIAVSPRHLGELTISMLRGEDGAQRKEFHKLIGWLRSPVVGRLNLGAIATNHIQWDQPHEGNLFDHLYARRAFQRTLEAVAS